MLRRFIWSSATRQQSSSSVGTEAFSTTVFTFAPKRAVPQKGTSGRPTRTEQHLEKEIARSAPRLALARESTQSKQGKGRSAPRVQQEEQYKHWYRHTYGVGDKRDTTWSVAHASFPDAPTAQTGHRRRQPLPQRTATILPYDSLARSMEIQQCSKVASDILAVVAGEDYAGSSSSSSSNTTGFGAEGALDVSPAVDSPRKCKGAKSRRAKAKAKAKARAEARSRDLLSARREHNADHAHWFKHTYCLPDWDVVLVETLLNNSPSSSSFKVHLHHASHSPSNAADNSTTTSSTSSNNTNNTINNKSCLCDLSRAARSSVEMSMLVQRLQNLSADPHDMTARTIFNMH